MRVVPLRQNRLYGYELVLREEPMRRRQALHILAKLLPDTVSFEYKGRRHVTQDHTGVPLARAILENALGRKLKRWELVHHIDENTKNDVPKNLLALTRKQHNMIHHGGWMSVKDAIDILERNKRPIPDILHNHRADALVYLPAIL